VVAQLYERHPVPLPDLSGLTLPPGFGFRPATREAADLIETGSALSRHSLMAARRPALS
jgi:hypothetical protein